MDLRGAAAIVSGGARGIGRAIALALAERGCNVAISWFNDAASAEATAAEIRRHADALVMRADVAADADCRALVAATLARWQRLDVLVNNAAPAVTAIAHAELDALDDAEWERLMAVNVRGVFALTRAAADALRAGPRGAVVNVSSIGGANSSSIAYSASKAALDDVTRSLARVLAPKVRVNAVAPGFVATDRMRDRFGARFDMVREMARRQMLVPGGTPEHVAQVVLSLVTGMDAVTGQVIIADAGAGLRGR